MKGSAPMQIWFVFSLVFSAVIAFFAVLNSDVVTIKLFWFNFELSQSLIILGSAASGAIIAIFLGLFSKIKPSLKIRELSSELKNANQKIDLLSSSLKDCEQKATVNQNEKPKSESVISESPTE
jgi:putative membrane protein